MRNLELNFELGTGNWKLTLWAALLCVVLSVYTASFMFRGWIPHDEGTFAQTAERVLHGEVPHRDFDEVYTGGVTYLNAAALRTLGTNLRSPRILLFGFFLAFLASVSTIARRIAGPLAASIATVLAVVWSVPNYFAALSSWYTLFFATFGILSLIRFLDTERRIWLVLAGMCGGFSMLAKITGIFYSGGALVFLLYLANTRSAPRGERPRPRDISIVITAIVALVVVVVLRVLSSRVTWSELVELAGPFVLVAMFAGLGTIRSGAISARVRELLSLMAPFALGGVLPLVSFLFLYWRAGALRELWHGVFIQPQARLEESRIALPALATIGLAVPYAALLVPRRFTITHESWWAAGLTLLLASALIFGGAPLVYGSVWSILHAVPLIAALACVWSLQHYLEAQLPSRSRELIFLLVTMAATLSLVQFPYATPIYFCYAAPVVILAVLALVTQREGTPRRVHASIAVFFALFAVLFVNRSYAWNLGVRFVPYHPTSRLDVDRGGLGVPEEDAREYDALAAVLRLHAAGGTIYASPDCPEVYFLSGFPNPTRMIFDFLDPEPKDERWITALLARAPIRAAVINTAPLFSPALDSAAVGVLEQRFPHEERIGRFVVRY